MEHVFKSKYRSPIGGITITFAVLITTLVVFGISFTILGIVMENPNALIYSIIIALVLFLLFMYKIFIINNVEYIVTDREVIFLKKGREYKNFPYSEYILSSYVVKHSVNGIPTATVRQLSVNDGKKEKKYTCELNKKNFDEFMSLILAYSNKTAVESDQVNTTETANINKEFTLNKDKILKKILLSKMFFFIIIFAACMAFFFTMYNWGEAGAEYFLYGGIITVVVFALIVGMSTSLIKKRTPDKISIRNNCIYVDDDNFNYSEIEKITLTPQSYSSGNQNRMMKIAKTDGTKVIYNLGFKAWKPNKPDSVFEKYDEFSYLLEGLFINTPGKFQYDL